jgi:hypothetical protein
VDCNRDFFPVNSCYLRYMVLLDEDTMETLVGKEETTAALYKVTRALVVTGAYIERDRGMFINGHGSDTRPGGYRGLLS